MNATPERNVHQDYITLRQLERAIQHACEDRGFDAADPLADEGPMATMGYELAAVDLFLALPKELSRLPGAESMCRAAARSEWRAAQ